MQRIALFWSDAGSDVTSWSVTHSLFGLNNLSIPYELAPHVRPQDSSCYFGGQVPPCASRRSALFHQL
jgi:hypothetical protein